MSHFYHYLNSDLMSKVKKYQKISGVKVDILRLQLNIYHKHVEVESYEYLEEVNVLKSVLSKQFYHIYDNDDVYLLHQLMTYSNEL